MSLVEPTHDTSRNTKAPDEPSGNALALAQAEHAQLLSALLQDGAPPEERSRKFSPESYFAVLRRRGWLMLAVFLLTATVVTWRLRPTRPDYFATATMLLPRATTNVSGAADALTMIGLRPSSGGDVNTEIAILTSPPVVEKALSYLKPELRQRGWPGGDAAGSINAVASVSPSLIDITVTSLDPDASTALANALIRAHAQRSRNQAAQANQESLVFVAQQKKEANDLLIKAKRELEQYRKKTGILSLEAKMNTVSSRVAQLSREVAALESDARGAAASAAAQEDSLANSLRQKADAAKINYETVSRAFVATSPEARRAGLARQRGAS